MAEVDLVLCACIMFCSSHLLVVFLHSLRSKEHEAGAGAVAGFLFSCKIVNTKAVKMPNAFENHGTNTYVNSGNGVYNHIVGRYVNSNYDFRRQNFSKGYGYPFCARTSSREMIIQSTVQGKLSWMSAKFTGLQVRKMYRGYGWTGYGA